MKNFEIGAGLTCDLERLVTTRLLVQANSGAGKSWLLRRLLEQTAGKIQHLVIDPEGEFSTLRERFDYVLAAKSGGDTAADPRTAKLLAERLLELGVSAILDIYELDPHARILFVRRFLEALVDAPKTLWRPVLVVVDEAHTFCPEVGHAESAAAVKSLATRGRKRGFCAVFATQRLSKFAKDAAAECNNKLIGRTSLDVDMARAGDELGFSKTDRQQLREVRDGEFFAFGPALSRIVTRVQVGPVQTTHPEAGGRLALAPPPPTSKVKALLPKLSDLPAEAADRERSLAELKTELANTKRELTLARKEHPAPTVETKVVEKAVLKDGQLARAEKLVERVSALYEALRTTDLVEQLRATANEIAGAIRHTQTPATMAQRVDRQDPVSSQGRRVAPVAATDRPASLVSPSSNGNGVNSGERKILTALAQYPGGRTKTQIAILTGYAHSGGGFNNYLSALRSKGYLAGSGDRLQITGAGVDALGPYDPLPAGADLRDYWLRQVGKSERLILEALAGAWPKAMSKEQLGAATNYEPSGGGFNNALSRLRTLELIQGRGELKASDELFD